ncbi:MAG: T9SS type A sorting domain-containing protein [Bacteroidales bacterium]|jgi:hypothetical protein|nr:T9SS type A sorting domain-containing protein [Bacteroidales bacterium]
MKKLLPFLSIVLVLNLGLKAQDIGGLFLVPSGDITVQIGADDSVRFDIQIAIANFGPAVLTTGDVLYYSLGLDSQYPPTPQGVALPEGYEVPVGEGVSFQQQELAIKVPADVYQVCFKTFGTSLGEDPNPDNDEVCFTLTVQSTSIEETSLEQFNVYPNPASDVVQISSPVNFQTLRVFDMTGREIYTEIVNANNTSLNVSNLNKGIYLITLEGENSKVTKKLSVR